MVVEIVFFLPVGRQDTDIGVLEEELWVEVAAHKAVGLDDLLQIDVDKVVVRVDVLLDQPLHLQERREQIPFAVVEGLEEGGELVFGLRVEWRLALARCFGGHGGVGVEVCRRLPFCGSAITANCTSTACFDVLRAEGEFQRSIGAVGSALGDDPVGDE